MSDNCIMAFEGIPTMTISVDNEEGDIAMYVNGIHAFGWRDEALLTHARLPRGRIPLELPNSSHLDSVESIIPRANHNDALACSDSRINACDGVVGIEPGLVLVPTISPSGGSPSPNGI